MEPELNTYTIPKNGNSTGERRAMAVQRLHNIYQQLKVSVEQIKNFFKFLYCKLPLRNLIPNLGTAEFPIISTNSHPPLFSPPPPPTRNPARIRIERRERKKERRSEQEIGELYRPKTVSISRR